MTAVHAAQLEYCVHAEVVDGDVTVLVVAAMVVLGEAVEPVVVEAMQAGTKSHWPLLRHVRVATFGAPSWHCTVTFSDRDVTGIAAMFATLSFVMAGQDDGGIGNCRHT